MLMRLITGFFLLIALPALAQSDWDNQYRDVCTIDNTTMEDAAAAFEVSLESVEYANLAPERYQEDYVIKPNCFFSVELYAVPLSARTLPEYPFVIFVWESDGGYRQVTPEGYFGDQGFGGYYQLVNPTFAEDGEGRWLETALAYLTIGQPWGGHALAFSSGDYVVRLEDDMIGWTFTHTAFVPEDGAMLFALSVINLDNQYENQQLNAVDYETGEYLWRVDLSELPVALLAPTADAAIVTFSDQLIAVDPADGTDLWTQALPVTLATAENGILYVISDEEILALDPVDGQLEWQTEVATGSIAIAHTPNEIIVAAPNTLAAFSTENGELLWDVDVDGEVIALDCHADHGCWVIVNRENDISLQGYDVSGSALESYALGSETADSPLHMRVQSDGWILVTGIGLHARTPNLPLEG
jgi:outer membrane protein assembly factor BamB